MVGPDVIPLPHIYGARIKGVEVFCPLDPPPPYEAVVSQMHQEQGSSFQMPEGSEAAASPLEPVCTQVTQGGDIPNTPGEGSTSISTPSSTLVQPVRSRRALPALRTRSKSDPVLHHSQDRDHGPVAAQLVQGPRAALAETAGPAAPAELRRPEHLHPGGEAPGPEEAPASGG
uniref:Endosomal transmembrane epsin interactor 1 n=1 Tax=Prolemur simus TaxID=1328070 RepID=A0A8C9AY61_PROSS